MSDDENTTLRCRAEFKNEAAGHPLADAIPNEAELAEWLARIKPLMEEEGLTPGDLKPFSEKGISCLALGFTLPAHDFGNKYDQLRALFARQAQKGQRVPFTLPFMRIRVGVSEFNF